MAHTDSHPAPAAQAQDNTAQRATLIGTLVHLWPYIWPGDRVDLKMRVVWSFVLLLVAKLATLSVPFTFKWAIDALTGADTAPVQSSNWALWLIASPLIMTLSYGAVRVLMAVLTQWRDGIFAKVAMHAVRKLAYLHLRSHARIVAALSPRAQDRRPDARAGARPPRHRGHRADGDPATGADHRRGHADHGRAAVAVRLALCAGDHDHRGRLHVLHLHRDRMADRDSPPG